MKIQTADGILLFAGIYCIFDWLFIAEGRSGSFLLGIFLMYIALRKSSEKKNVKVIEHNNIELETKIWFRIMKVFYIGLWIIGLLVGLIIFAMIVSESGDSNNGNIWIVPIYGISLYIILVLVKKTFYYIITGNSKN